LIPKFGLYVMSNKDYQSASSTFFIVRFHLVFTCTWLPSMVCQVSSNSIVVNSLLC
jgi:hypothetical protein